MSPTRFQHWSSTAFILRIRGLPHYPANHRQPPAMSLSATRQNLLAGITTAFALAPECIAFALVAQLHPLMGLYGAFIICCMTALFGGRPGMISGAAGSMAVVIVALVVQHGAQYLLATVLLSGLLMLLFGALRLGTLIRMVPHPVMLGFVNGLAIIIALAQLQHFKPGGHWLQGAALSSMLILTGTTILLVYLLPRVSRQLPAALLAIIGVALLSHGLGWTTPTLGDMAHIAGNLPSFSWPDVPLSLETLWIILPYAVLMAAIGLLETLLTLNLTDEITASHGQPNRECMALGAANLTSGLFGGMGGCAMIGQTMINLGAGGRSRLSGITCGMTVLLFVLFLSPWIEKIPLAALVGVMLVVAQRTFSWHSLRVMGKVPRQDALVILIVTLTTVFTDLALAVLIGILISALGFAWQQSRAIRLDPPHNDDRGRRYRAHGTLFFAATAHFQSLFEPAADPQANVLDCQDLSLADHSAIAALQTLQQRYQRIGKQLHFENLSPRCQLLLDKAGVATG